MSKSSKKPLQIEGLHDHLKTHSNYWGSCSYEGKRGHVPTRKHVNVEGYGGYGEDTYVIKNRILKRQSRNSESNANNSNSNDNSSKIMHRRTKLRRRQPSADSKGSSGSRGDLSNEAILLNDLLKTSSNYWSSVTGKRGRVPVKHHAPDGYDESSGQHILTPPSQESASAVQIASSNGATNRVSVGGSGWVDTPTGRINAPAKVPSASEKQRTTPERKRKQWREYDGLKDCLQVKSPYWALVGDRQDRASRGRIERFDNITTATAAVPKLASDVTNSRKRDRGSANDSDSDSDGDSDGDSDSNDDGSSGSETDDMEQEDASEMSEGDEMVVSDAKVASIVDVESDEADSSSDDSANDRELAEAEENRLNMLQEVPKCKNGAELNAVLVKYCVRNAKNSAILTNIRTILLKNGLFRQGNVPRGMLVSRFYR
jgi:hypothetical protein